MFEQENQFYEENRTNLREKYLEKSIVISKDELIGVYDDVGEAYRETIKTRSPGTFAIKSIPKDPEDEIISLSPIAYV